MAKMAKHGKKRAARQAQWTQGGYVNDRHKALHDVIERAKAGQNKAGQRITVEEAQVEYPYSMRLLHHYLKRIDEGEGTHEHTPTELAERWPGILKSFEQEPVAFEAQARDYLSDLDSAVRFKLEEDVSEARQRALDQFASEGARVDLDTVPSVPELTDELFPKGPQRRPTIPSEDAGWARSCMARRALQSEGKPTTSPTGG